MAYTPEPSFIKQFADNFEQLYMHGTEGSLLRPFVRTETQGGEMKFFDFIGETEGQERSSRDPITPNMEVPHTRRKSVILPWDWGKRIDSIDKVRMLKDPQSEYMRSAVAAYAKFSDMTILHGLGAIVYSGKEGTIAINNYDADECRIINGDGTLVDAGSDASDTTETYLTVAKVALMGDLMDDLNIPQSDRHIVASAINKWKFLQETDVKTYDVNTIKALAAGSLTDFMGFHFHWLPTTYFETHSVDTGCIKCFAFHKDSIMLATGTGPDAEKTEIYPHPDYCMNTQIYLLRMQGATRLQGKGVIEILLKKARS